MESCQYRLAKPKKKKRWFQEKESPYPIPIASIDGAQASNDKWCYYTGQLVDNHVQVVYTGDMELLFRMGFFGQENLWGRHGPQKEIHHKKRKRRGKGEEGRKLEILSRRKYLRRLGWADNTAIESTTSGLPTEILPLPKLPQYHEIHPSEEHTSKHEHAIVESSHDKDRETNQQSTIASSENAEIRLENHEIGTAWPTVGAGVENPWATTSNAGTGIADAWDTTTEQEAADFWGKDTSESVAKTGTEMIKAKDVQTNNTDVGKSHKSPGKQCSTSNHSISSQLNNKTMTDIPTSKEKNSSESSHVIPFNSTEEVDSTQMDSKENEEVGSTETQVLHDKDNKSQCDTMVDTPKRSVDPRCLSDHEDGSLFVVNDTDESDIEDYDVTMKSDNAPVRLHWQPAVKRNPYPIKEALNLTFEEAFFLCYGLGCLVVLDEDKAPMSLAKLWSVFCGRQPHFLQNYVVYHNFRSKGWVPKPGIKFGGDFIVYKEGPPFYHSSYVVLTRLVDEVTRKTVNTGQHPTLSWSALAGQNRITEQAAKELMMCYVLKPANLTEEEMSSPKCIKQFKVQEMIVKRWLTKHERDNMQYTEIP